MTAKQPPHGYDEIGKTLARPVVEGYKSKNWALEIAGLLEYGKSDLDAWLEWYANENREELVARQAEQQQRREEIKRCKAKARELVNQFDQILEEARANHTPRIPNHPSYHR